MSSEDKNQPPILAVRFLPIEFVNTSPFLWDLVGSIPKRAVISVGFSASP
jgi:hypothetical protein